MICYVINNNTEGGMNPTVGLIIIIIYKRITDMVMYLKVFQMWDAVNNKEEYVEEHYLPKTF